MSKKSQIKKIFESTSIESADAQPNRTESVQGEQKGEATPPVTNLQEDVIETFGSAEEAAGDQSLLPDEKKDTESISANLQSQETPFDPKEEGIETPSDDEQSSGETLLTSTSAQGSSAEDLLEDVRQSLIEEEIDNQKKESKWWRRIGRKGKRVEADQPLENVEIDLPATLTSPVAGVEDRVPEPSSEESVDELDELIDMLADTEEAPVESTVAAELQAPAEPEPEVDFEKLKEQAFQPRTPNDEPESDVRSVALEDGDEVFVEVQSRVPDTVGERLSAFENALRPYRWYINIVLAFFGVVVVVIVSLIMFNVYQQSRPQPPTQVSNLPYPTAVSLPGGWSFQLGRGTLQAGRWDPQGAEWLEGTEVCRWVALPWSRQLEAVVRTLSPKDPVELVMSNNDKLTYEVYSVRQLTLQQLQETDSTTPCLLLILTQSDSEKRWVLTALP